MSQRTFDIAPSSVVFPSPPFFFLGEEKDSAQGASRENNDENSWVPHVDSHTQGTDHPSRPSIETNNTPTVKTDNEIGAHEKD